MGRITLKYDNTHGHYHVMNNKGHLICNTFLWGSQEGMRRTCDVTELEEYSLCYECSKFVGYSIIAPW